MARRTRRGRHPHLGAKPSSHPDAAFLRRESPVRDRIASHVGHDIDRTGRRHDRIGGVAQQLHRRWRADLSVRTLAQAGGHADAGHSRDHPADHLARTAHPQSIAHIAGSRRRCRFDRNRDAWRDEDRAGLRAGAARSHALLRCGGGDLRCGAAANRVARCDDRNRNLHDLRIDHPGAVGRRDRCRCGPDQRRIDRCVRPDRRDRCRGVRGTDRGLWRSAARRGRSRATR